MRRRAFLAAAGTAALAGCGGLLPGRPGPPTPTPPGPVGRTEGSPTPTPTPTPAGTPEPPPFTDRFGRVVDVTRVGGDPSGGTSIEGLLREHAGDDTMLFFPPGRYRLSEPWGLEAFDNFGLVGRDAVIVPDDGAHETFITLGAPGQATGLVLAGLTFDYRAPQTGGRPFEVRVDDQLEAVDLRVVGTQDVRHDMMRFDVTSRDGTGVVRRLQMLDGGISKYRITGAYVGDTSLGRITFEDCHIENFPDNGLYASSAVGPVHVIGGTYANNGISNVRVGGRGLVRGVTIRCDGAPDTFDNLRGIRLDNGGTARIENCTIDMLDVPSSDGAITMSPWMASAVIRNTRIRVDVDGVDGIWAKQPADDLMDEPSLDVRDVDIVGAAGEGPTVQIDSRSGARLERVRIHQTGQDRDGILIQRSRDNVIRDSVIDVTGEPIVLDDAIAQTANLEYSYDRSRGG